ncbi:MAG: T9SS type A sorting domain-containing protein [Calditrichaeota bacterium]|nr:T9SS type A sorting domain-containing protein [Calditrichota bacterium]
MKKIFVVLLSMVFLLSFVSLYANDLKNKESLSKQELSPDRIADIGGPDNFGYRWVDSDEPGTDLEFDWIEINQIGQSLTLRDDEVEGPINMGFNFDFYGNTYNQVYISSNGYIAFGTDWSGWDHRFRSFPDGNEPYNVIAPLWLDLDPNEEEKIHYWTNNADDQFVVEWDDVPVHANEWYLPQNAPQNNPQNYEYLNTEWFEFTAGQNTDVGDIRVFQEDGDDDVYIQIDMSGGWKLLESHVDWGFDTDDIPHNDGGPIPGQMEYSENHGNNGVDEYTYRIDMDGSDFTGVFLVHGVVKHGNSNETAWAGDEEYPGNNWALYFEYGVMDYGNNGGGNNGGIGPRKFQIILNEDGTIVFQYHDNNEPTDQGVVGIQNINGTDGLTVSANDNYVYDGLAVRFFITNGDISGTVTDDDTGDPIEGATIVLSNSATTTTDQNGNYTFVNVLPGDYTIVANALNYVDLETGQFSVVNGQTTVVDIALTEANIGGGGNYDTPGTANNIFVWGNLMFVADGENGLLVYDISDPENPALISSYNTDGEALSVYVSGDYAYVADGSNGLVILDISDINNITLAGHYDSPGVSYHVYVVGNYAYLADGEIGMLVLNISDLQNIQFVRSYNTAGTAVYITIINNYACIADMEGGFYVIDIQDVYNLQLAGFFNTPGEVYNFQIVGDYVYVVDGDGGLIILDISDLGDIQVVGSFDTPGEVVSLYISGGYLFLLDDPNGLFILDISDPSDPTFVAQEQIQNGSWIVVINGIAYIAIGGGGFVTVDVSQFTGLPITIDLISPQGGGSYQPGDTLYFDWNVSSRFDIEDIVLYYSTDGGDRWISFATLAWDALDFEWIIPELFTTDFCLRIVITDVEGNESDVQICDMSVGIESGSSSNLFCGWNFFSLPLIPDDPRTSTIFGNNVPHPGIYAVYGFDYDVGHTVPHELENGLGYWSVIAHVPEVEIEYDGTARVDTFRHSLDLSWNMIGNPFPVDVPLMDVIWSWDGRDYNLEEACEDRLLVPILYGYDNEIDYFESQTLQPWHGYWFLALVDSIEMIIPPPLDGGAPDAVGNDNEPIGLASSDTPGMWEVSLHVQTAEAQDRAVFGTTLIASDGYDGLFDYPEPRRSRASKWVRAYWTQNDWLPQFTSQFNRDIRSPMNGDSQEWGLTIQTNDPGQTRISWAGSMDKAPDHFEFTLIDVVTGQRINMLENDEFVFQNNGQYRNFTIHVNAPFLDVAGNAMAPEEFELLSAYPNPFNSSLTLRYNLKQSSDVKLNVYDMRGSLVQSLVVGEKPKGTHSIVWNANQASAGVYMVKLENSGQTTMRKVMLLR